jgi:hypothetical protein
MDLRAQFPRSPREKLAGYVHLARMTDKCRATLAGTQGEYKYPCPMDQRLLDFAGITAEQFTTAVRSAKNDQALTEWFTQAATPHSSDDIARWNQTFLTWEPDTDEKRTYFNKLRDAADPSRTDITTWADLLDVDEKRPVPKRTAKVRG